MTCRPDTKAVRWLAAAKSRCKRTTSCKCRISSDFWPGTLSESMHAQSIPGAAVTIMSGCQATDMLADLQYQALVQHKGMIVQLHLWGKDQHITQMLVDADILQVTEICWLVLHAAVLTGARAPDLRHGCKKGISPRTWQPAALQVDIEAS